MPDLKTRLLGQRSARQPEPWAPSPFAVVAGLVQDGRWGADLWRRLRELAEAELEVLLPGLPRAKSTWHPPLFPLLPAGAYRLVQALLARLNNPYVVYARDVDELCLSPALARTWEGLPPEVLSRCHFANLLVWRGLRREIAALEKQDEPDLSLEQAVRLAANLRHLGRLEAHLLALGVLKGTPPP